MVIQLSSSRLCGRKASCMVRKKMDLSIEWVEWVEWVE